ncbi:MAG: hypothetical protein Q7K26_01620 [bacterium]|nr:hypothetical protein [bacterium]
MNEIQYEDLERYHSEQAAENYFRQRLPDEDECILLSKASELLDQEDIGIRTDRKGLERFSLFLLSEDNRLEHFVQKLKNEVLVFENALVQRDELTRNSHPH